MPSGRVKEYCCWWRSKMAEAADALTYTGFILLAPRLAKPYTTLISNNHPRERLRVALPKGNTGQGSSGGGGGSSLWNAATAKSVAEEAPASVNMFDRDMGLAGSATGNATSQRAEARTVSTRSVAAIGADLLSREARSANAVTGTPSARRYWRICDPALPIDGAARTWPPLFLGVVQP